MANRCTGTPGEAWLYVVEGDWPQLLGHRTRRRQNYPWKKGDLIVVDHFLWHQHFNDDPEKTGEGRAHPHVRPLLETMRALMDPMVLFEEPPDTSGMPRPATSRRSTWPEVTRPTWP